MVGKIKVYQLDPQTQGKLRRLFNGGRCEFAQFGDIRCIMPSSYKDDADSFRNMVVRADDVWVVTFPRSGTTWMQELVWMVMNNFDYDKSSKIPLMRRYIFLEINNVTKLIPARRQITDPVLLKYIKVNQSYEDIVKAPSPRFIKTHMPLSLLPVNLLDTTKVVYVARDPRDVAVSLLHHHKLIFSCSGEFKTYWNLFIQNLTFRAPYFAHLKEAWALRRHPNMLFIFYEEMIKVTIHIIYCYGDLGADAKLVKLDSFDIARYPKSQLSHRDIAVNLNINVISDSSKTKLYRSDIEAI